ncbi:hypothetical protein VKT23_015128 [Stygiomarasmius scandens]|uniref:Uncharacterized protein n=1 Tax=Marasmiellus scandens TaxID=2682957 RepID=A0ABR1J394_9AGAR
MPSRSSLYTRTTIASCHMGPVFSLSVSKGGSFIASGGMYSMESTGGDLTRVMAGADKVKIWDVSLRKERLSPAVNGFRGPATALAWLYNDGPEQTLIFGTLYGYVACWKQSAIRGGEFREISLKALSSPSEVTSVVFDPLGAKVAIVNDRNEMHLYRVDGNFRLLNVFTIVLPDAAVRDLAFVSRERGKSDEILAFGMDSNVIRVINAKDGTISRRYEVQGNILAAQVHRAAGVVAIYLYQHSQGQQPIISTVALYRLGDFTRIRAFPMECQHDYVKSCQVALFPDAKQVVCGGGNGLITVFDRKTGKRVESLQINSQDEWVQLVTVFAFCCTIAL